MVEEERFERIYNMIEVNSDTKYEEFPENREIFFLDINILEQKTYKVLY